MYNTFKGSSSYYFLLIRAAALISSAAPVKSGTTTPTSSVTSLNQKTIAQTFTQTHHFCTKSNGMSDPKTVTNPADESYTPGTSSVAFVTTPDENSAKKLAHGLIEKKLAACVNIIPQIQSVYMWDGKINEDNEYLMMIKTRTSRLEELTKWVRDNHPYSVAEVITLPIEQGNVPYLSWIAQTVPEKK